MYNIVFKIMKKNERNLLTTTYIVKKKFLLIYPHPLSAPPLPQLHIVSICALLNKFRRKKKYKGTLSHKNGCLLEFF